MGRRKRRKWRPYVTPPRLLLISALHTIHDLPMRQHVRALRVLAETYRDLFTEFGEPLPEWVHELAQIAHENEALLRGYDTLTAMEASNAPPLLRSSGASGQA